MTIIKQGVNMVWFEKEVENQAKVILRGVSKEIAEKVARDAKGILTASPQNLQDLANQIDVIPSRYDETSFLVWCQSPRNWKPPYRASFIELGYHSAEWGRYKRGSKAGHKFEPMPFMRPAAHRNKRKAKKMYQDALK
jgi:hypothetical protein